MSMRSLLGRIRRKSLELANKRTVSLGSCGPIVSFTFDDFPRSALLTGGAILERFGAHGTYYVTPSLMNTTGELGELFRENDLTELMQNGHEVGSHTFSHSSCRSLSVVDFLQEVRKSVQTIQEMTGRRPENFAYPFGHVTVGAKKALENELTSARGIFPGLNGPEIDLNLLRANSLYGNMQHAAKVKKLVLENKERKGWLIFYTHDVRPNPSEYGSEPALLEWAVSCARESGARILTIQEALSEVHPGTSSPMGELADRTTATHCV
jgi:peptidoglycan/xylan/chitin deacetylase (PgdA/CDA1 family)